MQTSKTGNTERLVHDPEGLNTASWPVRSFVTPTDHFFTRSHAAVPHIDAASYALRVGGLVAKPQTLTLDALSRLPRREVAATLVCAGMRRSEFLTLGPLPGELPWGPEPASTANWGGVSLRDALALCDVEPSARFVEFVGLDDVERHGHRFGFGGSVDLRKAMDADVLLAMTLNGAPLPPAHGYPVRAIVPGWIGARSVKWLGAINVLDRPSQNYFQTKAYRVQQWRNPEDARDVTAGAPLTEVPLNSVFTEPVDGATVAAGEVRVEGWALGRGGSAIESVEFSMDDGETWRDATLRREPRASRWTWTFWNTMVTLEPGEYTLIVRATDASGAAQPERVEATWNVKGYVNNAWHRVTVRAE